MRFVIFDTETTGLTQSDEVIQFAGLVVETTSEEEKQKMTAEGKTPKNLKLKNFCSFYCDTVKTINPEAQKIHGIDKETLKKLSENYTFEDNFFPFVESLGEQPKCWVAYNIEFDKRLVNQTLGNNGLPTFSFGKNIATIREENEDTNFCLMNAMTSLNTAGKRRKLVDVVASLGYSKETIDKSFAAFAARCNMSEDLSFHNAAYDVYCTYLVLEHHFNKLRA